MSESDEMSDLPFVDEEPSLRPLWEAIERPKARAEAMDYQQVLVTLYMQIFDDPVFTFIKEITIENVVFKMIGQDPLAFSILIGDTNFEVEMRDFRADRGAEMNAAVSRFTVFANGTLVYERELVHFCPDPMRDHPKLWTPGEVSAYAPGPWEKDYEQLRTWLEQQYTVEHQAAIRELDDYAHLSLADIKRRFGL